ncbi:unnamed protein product [Prunus armeniaca]|uniref:RNase H type-1 domain-containing protein n=1 Tax=Prunus armeniaca TaxID=36596 RepID=A0A6J5VCG7_PRUAR|nr:unnamed protein product [Prunus armeniaca]
MGYVLRNDDRLVWHHEKKGCYTVRSGYWLACAIRDREDGEVGASNSNFENIWLRLWRMQVANKVKVFLWRCMHEILPCRQKLFLKQVVSNPICLRCHQAPKTVLHALWDCPAAREVWQFSALQDSCNSAYYGCFLNLFHYILTVLTDKELRHFGYICWNVWNGRNTQLFQGYKPNAFQSYQHMQEMAEEFYQANCTSSRSTQDGSNRVVNWERPPAQFVKINVDGTLKTYDSVRVLGVVIRDERGELIAAAAKPVCGMFTPNVTELFAIRFGLQLARVLGLKHIYLESDAQAAIRMAFQCWESNREISLYFLFHVCFE